MLKIVKPDFTINTKEEEKSGEKKVKKGNSSNSSKSRTNHQDPISSTISRLKSIAKTKRDSEQKEIESFEDLAGYQIEPDSSDEEIVETQDQIHSFNEEPDLLSLPNVSKRYGVTMKQENKSRSQQEESKEREFVWVPPEDQKGDGKTKLNEKFNY